MNTTTATTPSAQGVPSGGLPARPASRTEGLVQIVIVIAVGAMAGAASFTHVHDWTMANTPAGTPGWFGWGNAVISELTPLAAGLEIRRRKRSGQPSGYPMAVLIAAAALSLSAQVAVARPSATGWLLSAVPALAFLALTKLVLARTPATIPATAEPAGTPAVAPASAPALAVPTITLPAAAPAEVPAHLLAGARFAANSHHTAHGDAIDADALAARMNIDHETAAQLLAAITPAPVNGTPVLAGESR